MEINSAAAAGLGLIEKASELQWAMRLASAVLFVDLALLWRAGHGIVEWSASTDQLMQNSGVLIAGLLGFATLSSVIVPIWVEVLRRLTWEVVIHLPTLSSIRTPASGFPGQVKPGVVRDTALAKSDAFMYARWREHDQARSDEEKTKLQISSLAVSVMTLSIANYSSASLFGFTGVSMLKAFEHAFDPFGSAVLLGLVATGLVALRWAWFMGWGDSGWIHYPSLYVPPASRAGALYRGHVAQHDGNGAT